MIKELKNDLVLFFKSMRLLNISRIKLFIVFITMIGYNILNLITPLLFGKIVNGIINKSIIDIKINMMLMILTFFISIIINYINNIITIHITSDIEIKMKEKVFNSILKIRYLDFLKEDKGKFINNIEYDSTVFSELLSNNINIFMSFINIFISLFIMLYISPLLTVILILILPIIGLIYIISGRNIKNKEIIYREKNDKFFTFLNETIYGFKFIKLFNAEKKRNVFFKSMVNNLYSLAINKFNIQICSGILINIVSFFANIFSIIVGIYLIFSGKLSLGMLTAFNNYAEIFKNSSLSFAQLNSTIQEISISLKRVNKVLEYKNHDDLKTDFCKTLNNKIQTLEIKNLSYSVSDDIEILDRITVKFKTNNIYILKGKSGSGKTTLLNIICNFIDTYTGDVLINGENIRFIETEVFRNKLSYITQDNFLFSLSIKENIALYRDIPFSKIVNICKKLNIHNTIMSLPNKYETVINENGTDLSGGEKQRLCIARAIVGNPDIYLFDEITSAIDNSNKYEILKIIEEISKNSIVILTSHEDLKFSVPVIEYNLIDKKLKNYDIINVI